MAGKSTSEAKAALAALKADLFNKHQLEATAPETEIRAISTGNVAIDYALGVGGLPLGRITELYGPTGCGKTTTALQTAGQLQQIIMSGGDERLRVTGDDAIMFLDYEHALDGNYAKALGLDITDESFMYFSPDDLDQGADAALDAIRSGLVRMVIVDSVALMQPKKMLENDAAGYSVGLHARMMTEFLNRATPIAFKNNCAIVLINHLKEAIGMSMPGRPAVKTTPGGKGLKYVCSVRIEYTALGAVKGKVDNALTGEREDEAVARNTKIAVTKNKLAPTRTVVAQVRRGKGFDNLMTSVEVLGTYGQISIGKSGFYDFQGVVPAAPEAKLRGVDAVLAWADKMPAFRTQIIDKARELLFAQPDVMPENVDPDTGELLDDEPMSLRDAVREMTGA